MPPDQVLAVAVHDIEPATFERAALIRDWLDDLGVDRVTLLVIPARDMHPLSDRRPEVGPWLLERACRGDAVAQHGFCHLQSHPVRFPRHPLAAIGSEAPEFIGLDLHATARALDAGRRVLKLAGVEPSGFVAPAYAYTPQLRDSLRTRFRWWAGSWALHSTRAEGHRYVSGPPIGLAAAGPLRRLVSPAILRVASRLAGPTLRVDVHPLDLASPSHMLALEDVIRRARRRRGCVTYDDLVASHDLVALH
jgi:predicted deacetylase